MNIKDIMLNKISLLLFLSGAGTLVLSLQRILQVRWLLGSGLRVMIYIRQAVENAEVFYFISWRLQGKGKLGQLETVWHFLIGSY